MEKTKLTNLLQIARKLPTTQSETNINKTVSEFFQKSDKKLTICKDDSLGDFIKSEHNSEGYSFRSPWSNKYFPEIETSKYPPNEFRELEILLNKLFKEYSRLYYGEKSVSSVYVWELGESIENGFTCALLVKNSLENESEWESSNVVTVKFMKEKDKDKERLKVSYKIQTNMIYRIVVSTLETSGSLSRLNEENHYIKGYLDYENHIEKIGKLVEASENSIRNSIDEIYIKKSYELNFLMELDDVDKMKAVINFRKTFQFLNFCNKIKKRLDKKYKKAATYIFCVKAALRNFISDIIYRAKESELYKLMITLNYANSCKLFFTRCKKKIIQKKSKIEYEKHFKPLKNIYRNNLLSKFFRGYKQVKNKKRHDDKISDILIQKYRNYRVKNFIKRIIAFKKAKFLNIRTKQFMLKLSYRKILNNLTYENTKIQKDQISRKLKYTLISKIFYLHVKKIINKKIIFQSKYFERLKHLYFKHFTMKLKNLNDNKKKVRHTNRKFYEFTVLKFFKLNKNFLQFKRSETPKLTNLIKAITRFELRRNFMCLVIFFNFMNNKTYEKNKKFIVKIFIRFCTSRSKIKASIENRIKLFDNSQAIKSKIHNSKQIVILNIKNIVKSLIKQKNVRKWRINNFQLKFFKYLSYNKETMHRKKEKYILALLKFRNSFIKKAFRIITLNKIISTDKNLTYQKISQERNILISDNLFRLMVIKSASQIKQNEEQIASVFLKRNARGLATALLWYKKLKTQIQIKKIRHSMGNSFNSLNPEKLNENTCVFKNSTDRNIFSQMATLKSNDDNKLTSNYQHTKQLENDVNILIGIKNKIRRTPKKLDI